MSFWIFLPQSNNFRDSFNTDWLKICFYWNTMTGKISSNDMTVKVKCENQMLWIFFLIISHIGLAEWCHATWCSSFMIVHHFTQFPFNVKKKIQKKSFPCIAKKNTAGQRRCCHAVVLSWTIKYLDFQKLAGLWLARWLIILGFTDLMWPRVSQRSNVGLVTFSLLWDGAGCWNSS